MHETTETATRKRLRLWLPIALICIYWVHFLAMRLLDIQSFASFLSGMALLALAIFGFLGWWTFNRSLTGRERLAVVAAAVVGAAFALLLIKSTLPPPFLIMLMVPWVLTVWAVWLLIARDWAPARRTGGLVLCLALAWGAFLLVRVEGLRGNMQAEVHWRWSPNAEESYLAGHPQSPAATAPATAGRTVAIQSGDWPGFRGPARDGVVHGLKINTDWNAAPPKVLWKQRVGPAWSSMAVVGGLVYTQEQRDKAEAVVCRDAGSGSEVWVHQDAVRFNDAIAGPGPRATPTFSDGRLYTLGGTGNLNCLDPATGQVIWTHDIAADAPAKPPIWGFSSSPLVSHGLVTVFAGGDGPKSLLAYRTETGQLAWGAPAGKHAYASTQVATLAGREQLLLFTDLGLSAFDPENGSLLWKHPVPQVAGLPPCLQAQPIGSDDVLISWGNGIGTVLLHVAQGNGGWTVSPKWTSKRLKATFDDLVVHDGHAYAFDGSTFCCLDLASGNRAWRDGHYGNGQVLLLADQGLLLVTSEDGGVVLLSARPDRHEELARVPVVSGKAWNHPAVAGGKLFVRSDSEMACLELPAAR